MITKRTLVTEAHKCNPGEVTMHSILFASRPAGATRRVLAAARGGQGDRSHPVRGSPIHSKGCVPGGHQPMARPQRKVPAMNGRP
jgi:hypothetical protein